MHAKKDNPELMRAKELNIVIKSYPFHNINLSNQVQKNPRQAKRKEFMGKIYSQLNSESKR